MDYTFESLMFDIEMDMCCESFDAAMEAKDGKGVFGSLKEMVMKFVGAVVEFIQKFLPKGKRSEVVVDAEEQAEAVGAIEEAVEEVAAEQEADGEEKVKLAPFKAIGQAVNKLKNGFFDNTTLGKLLAAMAKAVKDAWEEGKNDKEAKVFGRLKKLFSAVVAAFNATRKMIKVEKLADKEDKLRQGAFVDYQADKEKAGDRKIAKADKLRDKRNNIQ